MTIHSRYIDVIILTIAILTMLDGVFYFSDLSTFNTSNEFYPLREYLTNDGIYKIATAQFILTILMLVLLTYKILKKGKIENPLSMYTLLILSIGLGILPWIEMYYGSTFYYGEVRDKQGLGFPMMSLLFLIYPIWIFKEERIKLDRKQLSIRIIVTFSIVLASSIFYGQIYEPWKLWQS